MKQALDKSYTYKLLQCAYTLTGIHLGYVINFNTVLLRDGTERLVNDFDSA